MAFHRGALRALDELKLVDSIKVVSTVSGGSVFGAAWLCSRLEDRTTTAFLDGLVDVLEQGFLWPALLSPRAMKVFLPGFTRTDRLAEHFSTSLFGQRKLSDLPHTPTLCLNAAALNHAMPARFSQDGFSCSSVGQRLEDGSYPETALDNRDLGFAVAASACFPFALPPLTLNQSELPPFQGSLAGQTELYLTDGGVLENLGVERLLGSGTFQADDIICCDAGAANSTWAPSLGQSLLSAGAFVMSRQTLYRLLIMMNDKQNKTMRQFLMREMGVISPPPDQRGLWLVRIDQTWDGFFTGISNGFRRRLARQAPFPAQWASAREVVEFLEAQSIDLSRAKAHFQPADAAFANSVGTNFTGLSKAAIAALERHAAWQTYACHAVFGGITQGSY